MGDAHPHGRCHKGQDSQIRKMLAMVHGLLDHETVRATDQMPHDGLASSEKAKMSPVPTHLLLRGAPDKVL